MPDLRPSSGTARQVKRLTTGLQILALSFACGMAFAAGNELVRSWSRPAPAVQAGLDVASGGLPNLPLTTVSVVRVVQKAAPSVVEIDAITRGTGGGGGLLFPFFGFTPPSGGGESLGSGFVLTRSGYIATNEHVVDGAVRISVVVPGLPHPLPARLVGADWQSDLAVLKVNPPRPLRPLPLDLSPVQVGEPVVAIGNPYGLQNTVTEGVISAVGRPLTIGNRPYSNLLQTSAAINPGNSGGPLLDMLGRVVGINTAVSAQGTGIGFAIPADRAEKILLELMRQGYVAHAFLGVGVTDLSPLDALSDGLPSPVGAQVVEVYAGSPAAAAGLSPGDVILAVNGHQVPNVAGLVRLMDGLHPGQRATLLVLTGSGTAQVTLTLAREPRQLGAASRDLYGATPV